MATLEEVLALESSNDYIHDNIQFIIDEDMRTIAIPPKGVVAGVTGDKNVNYINFKMNRFYNGIDLSDFNIRINYVNANGDLNYFTVTDTIIEDDFILFAWLLDSDVTAYKGQIIFAVYMFILDGDELTQVFNSTKANLTVLEGVDVDEYIIPEKRRDLIDQIAEEVGKKTQPPKEYIIYSPFEGDRYEYMKNKDGSDAGFWMEWFGEDKQRTAYHYSKIFTMNIGKPQPNVMKVDRIIHNMEFPYDISNLYMVDEYSNVTGSYAGVWLSDGDGYVYTDNDVYSTTIEGGFVMSEEFMPLSTFNEMILEEVGMPIEADIRFEYRTNGEYYLDGEPVYPDMLEITVFFSLTEEGTESDMEAWIQLWDSLKEDAQYGVVPAVLIRINPTEAYATELTGVSE